MISTPTSNEWANKAMHMKNSKAPFGNGGFAARAG
jgi:hypothetical protein